MSDRYFLSGHHMAVLFAAVNKNAETARGYSFQQGRPGVAHRPSAGQQPVALSKESGLERAVTPASHLPMAVPGLAGRARSGERDVRGGVSGPSWWTCPPCRQSGRREGKALCPEPFPSPVGSAAGARGALSRGVRHFITCDRRHRQHVRGGRGERRKSLGPRGFTGAGAPLPDPPNCLPDATAKPTGLLGQAGHRLTPDELFCSRDCVLGLHLRSVIRLRL